jgi:hypothetical protein
MLCEAKVDGDGLGVTDVEETVWFGRESGSDFWHGLLFVDALQPALREDARRLALCAGLGLLFGSEGMLGLLGLCCCFLCGLLERTLRRALLLLGGGWDGSCRFRHVCATSVHVLSKMRRAECTRDFTAERRRVEFVTYQESVDVAELVCCGRGSINNFGGALTQTRYTSHTPDATLTRHPNFPRLLPFHHTRWTTHARIVIGCASIESLVYMAVGDPKSLI